MGKNKGKDGTAFQGVVIGLGVMLLVSMGLLAILAKMFLVEVIGEGKETICVAVTLLIASILGTYTVCRTEQKRKVKLSAMVVVLYFMLQFVTGLAMEGSFKNIWLNAMLLLVGCVVSCLICPKKGKMTVRKKRTSC